MEHDEKQRLEDLYSYQISNTPPEQELNELAEIASLLFDMPISLVTIIDEDTQWFKAKVGVEEKSSPREVSFCQHTLGRPEEVLVVTDALNDPLFKDNPLVADNPNIRFYAGAPLQTVDGNVLGTLCILDVKPRTISPGQQKALQMLAKKAMDYLNTRRLLLLQKSEIATNAERLRKLTDNVPGGIFQLRMYPDESIGMEFLSQGFLESHTDVDPLVWKAKPELGFSLVHPDDIENLQGAMRHSFQNLTPLNVEYRIESNGKYTWRSMAGNPERSPDGSVVWYSHFQDISQRMAYEEAMEQMAFDISHVLRKPVANLLGLAQAVAGSADISKAELLEYVDHIRTVSEEMDQFTKRLDSVYRSKQEIMEKSGSTLKRSAS